MPSSETKSIEIVVNGDPRTVPDGLTVRGLLQVLEIPMDRVAVELDRAIVRNAQWDRVEVRHGAVLEIVQFVGGG